MSISINVIHHGYGGTSTFVGDEPIRLQVVPFKGTVKQPILNISGFALWEKILIGLVILYLVIILFPQVLPAYRFVYWLPCC